MNRTSTLSLERRRAAYAFREVAEWDHNWREEATQRAKGLPVELRSQGLIVTIAKLLPRERREKPAEIRLADAVARWLLQDSPLKILPAPTIAGRPGEQLLAACRQADRTGYRRVQNEALAFLTLVKLFSDACYGAGRDRTRRELAEQAPTPLAIGAVHKSDVAQTRYAFAFEQVLEWEKGSQTAATTRAKSLPIEVRAEGLLVALANLMRDGRQGHRTLAALLAHWLLVAAPRKPLDVAEEATGSPNDLLKACALATRIEYSAAQTEALAVLAGIKVYSNALYSDLHAPFQEGIQHGD